MSNRISSDQGSFELPAYLEYDFPSVPSLEDTKAYAAWRDECLKVREIPHIIMAELLESIGTDIAFLRAAIILGNFLQHHSFASRMLVGAFSGRRVVYLMAKCVEAQNVALRGYAVDSQVNILGLSMNNVLQAVLEEVSLVQDRTPLHLELEVRAHSALSESLALSENYDAAIQHASEVILLAPHIGLQNIAMGCKYLIADIQFRQGNLIAAKALIEEVIDSPATQTDLLETAVGVRALVQYWLGDETACLATLASLDAGIAQSFWWVETFTMRQQPSGKEKYDELAKYYGLAHTLAMFAKQLMKAQEVSPERESTAHAIYKTLGNELHQSRSVFRQGWLVPFAQCLELFAGMRSRSFEFPNMHLPCPTPEAIQAMPPTARALSCAILIEVGITRLISDPTQTNVGSIYAALDGLTVTFENLEEHVLEQIARKLQLLCPTALALVAVAGASSQVVLDIGTGAVMNLRQRPISVYGSSGLRPIHAAQLTLKAFGRYDLVSFSRGGSQARDLRNVLYRAYFGRSCWFDPIPPSLVVFILLVLRDFADGHQQSRSQVFQQAASRIYKTFGICPRLQQTEKILELEHLEEVLIAGLDKPLDMRQVFDLSSRK